MNNILSNRIVGLWITDIEQSHLHPDSNPRSFFRVIYEFHADGTFSEPSLRAGGRYHVKGHQVVVVGEFIDDMKFKESPWTWYLNDEASTLTSKSDNSDLYRVMVRVDTARGKQLWERAFCRPPRPTHEELSELIYERLRAELDHRDINPDTKLYQGGLGFSGYTIGVFSGKLSRELENKWNCYITPCAGGGSNVVTVSDYIDDLYDLLNMAESD